MKIQLKITHKCSHLSCCSAHRINRIRNGSMLKKLLANLYFARQSSKVQGGIFVLVVTTIWIGPLYIND